MTRKADDDPGIGRAVTRLTRALVARRVELGLSQRQVASLINRTSSSVSALESGRYRPQVNSLVTYGHAVGMTLIWITDEDDDATTKEPDNES